MPDIIQIKGKKSETFFPLSKKFVFKMFSDDNHRFGKKTHSLQKLTGFFKHSDNKTMFDRINTIG